MSKVKFRKIKLEKDGKVKLEFFEEKQNGGDPDEHTFVSSDRPNPSFPNSMLRLRKAVCEICELPTTDDFIRSIEVRGLSISHSERDGMGITITALRNLEHSDCPLVLNTPHKTEDGENPKRIMPSWAFNECMVVMEEAQAYLEGDREQIDLFAELNKPQND